MIQITFGYQESKKDIHFQYPSSYGNLDISINLSKPEKDPNDIKKLLTQKK